jgi:parvulin-like peptidyl-prolyl isomerase
MSFFSSTPAAKGSIAPVSRAISTVLLTGLLAVSISLSGCTMGQSGLGGVAKGGPTVATVNGQVITKNEYDKVHDFFGKLMQVDSNPQMTANPVVTEVLKQMTLNKLMVMALVEQEAKKRGITTSDEELKAALEKQQKLAGGAGVLTSLLAKQKMTQAEFESSLKEQILLDEVVMEMAKEDKTGNKLAVTPEELKTIYKEHAQEFMVPESIRSSHILVKAIEPELRNEISEKNKDMKAADLDKAVAAKMAAQKAKAEELLAKIKADPTQFDVIAASQNDDEMAGKTKGDLGFMTQQATDPAYWQAVAATPVGKLRPELVKSSFGFHIVQVLEKKAPHQQTFDEVKGNIEQQLEQQKKGAFLKEWLVAQQKVASIKIEDAYKPTDPKQLQQKAGGMPPAAAPEKH